MSPPVPLSPEAFLALAPLTNQTATVGTPFSYNVSSKASGGTPPYHWAADDLPSPLVIGASSGIISGTPAATSGETVVVTLTDSASDPPQSQPFTLNVSAVPAPTITSLSATSGPIAGGTAVTITGTNFVSGATVAFGDIAANSVVFHSSTSISCVSPTVTGAATVEVTVTTTSGVSNGSGFTYQASSTNPSGVAPPVVGTTDPVTGLTWGMVDDFDYLGPGSTVGSDISTGEAPSGNWGGFYPGNGGFVTNPNGGGFYAPYGSCPDNNTLQLTLKQADVEGVPWVGCGIMSSSTFGAGGSGHVIFMMHCPAATAICICLGLTLQDDPNTEIDIYEESGGWGANSDTSRSQFVATCHWNNYVYPNTQLFVQGTDFTDWHRVEYTWNLSEVGILIDGEYISGAQIDPTHNIGNITESTSPYANPFPGTSPGDINCPLNIRYWVYL